VNPKVPVPARLFGLLAREAPVGVIIRRGPYQWVQLIKWNTSTDTFELGQWFHGRIYEYTGDLSPDGKLLFYTAFKRNNYWNNPEYGNTWLAISKSPYFTALALWFPDAFQPGGHFVDNETIQLYGSLSQHPNHAPSELNITYDNPQYASFPHKDAFFNHQGWKIFQSSSVPFDKEVYVDPRMKPNILWSKRSNNIDLYARWRGYLRSDKKNSPGGQSYQFEYSISSSQTDQKIVLTGVNWADFDQQGRLVLARAGKLFTATVANDAVIYRELADFNDHRPEPMETPDWAKKW